jgi:LacI family transcriptional regulator
MSLKRIYVRFPVGNRYFASVLEGIAKYGSGVDDWRFINVYPGELAGEEELLGADFDGAILYDRSEEEREYLDSKHIPVVMVGELAGEDPTPRVSVGNFAAGRCAAEHLLATGIRTFGYIGHPTYLFSRERRQGFMEAIARAGMPCQLYEDSRVVLEDFRASKMPEPPPWLKNAKQPTGVFACTDTAAVLCLAWCHRLKLNVPEEVAIVGCDNFETLCLFCHPTITSVDINIQRVGYEAAGLLHRVLQGRKYDPRIFVPPLGLIARGSTDVVSAGDTRIAEALQYIRHHALEDLTVEDVLNEVPISRRALERGFRELIGRTPLGEIRRLQLDHAKRLLTTTDYKVSRVAKEAGLREGRYLAAVFRKELGMTPTRFRQRNRKP